MINRCKLRGVHPPETMMHFPLFQISPYFRKIFRLWGKFSQFEKFLHFHPPKFLMTFFSHRPQISNFAPIFPVSVHVPPCFAKIIISPPILTYFPDVLDTFTCFLHTLRVFRFPPTLTMMHLCIIQCTYWTPLCELTNWRWKTVLFFKPWDRGSTTTRFLVCAKFSKIFLSERSESSIIGGRTRSNHIKHIRC